MLTVPRELATTWLMATYPETRPNCVDVTGMTYGENSLTMSLSGNLTRSRMENLFFKKPRTLKDGSDGLLVASSLPPFPLCFLRRREERNAIGEVFSCLGFDACLALRSTWKSLEWTAADSGVGVCWPSAAALALFLDGNETMSSLSWVRLDSPRLVGLPVISMMASDRLMDGVSDGGGVVGMADDALEALFLADDVNHLAKRATAAYCENTVAHAAPAAPPIQG
mmetsp:Transcript_24564/g.68468  ORF Transcript_24564/g.68468 Transcript_24564/m.68468 type:complete len:225 (-) Transcript_24564:48-722(-)